MSYIVFGHGFNSRQHQNSSKMIPESSVEVESPHGASLRAFLLSKMPALTNHGRRFSIAPGMIATVDIKTGEKTIVDYLIKPFNRAKEALRER